MSVYPKFPFSCYHFICSIKWEPARKPCGRPSFHCLLPQTWPNLWPSQFPFLSSSIGYSGSRKVLEQVLVFRTWSGPPNPPAFSQRHHQMQTPGVIWFHTVLSGGSGRPSSCCLWILQCYAVILSKGCCSSAWNDILPVCRSVCYCVVFLETCIITLTTQRLSIFYSSFSRPFIFCDLFSTTECFPGSIIFFLTLLVSCTF